MQTQIRPSNEQDFKRNFFISFADGDDAWADWIAWLLEDEDYSVYHPNWDSLPGSNRIYNLHEALKGAERILILLSSRYLSALFAQPEWAVAFENHLKEANREFLIVRIDSCEKEGLFLPITSIDLLDLEQNFARKRLLDDLKDMRKKPLSEPRYPGKTPLFVGNILERNPAFVGRELALKTIYATLQKGAIVSITYALTASASGSIGKTQLALEYVYRYKFNYDTILWLQVPDQLERFLENVRILFPLLEIPINTKVSLEDNLANLKNWLYEHENWLLVIDNISNIPIFDQILSDHPSGHVLLTTRERAFATRSHLIELEQRTLEEEELSQKISSLIKIALYGDGGKRLSLKPGRNTLGSDPANDLPIENSTVSAFHAVIKLGKDAYYITDLGSDHGTFVDGERIPARLSFKLLGNNSIQLGSYAFAYGSLDKPVTVIPAVFSESLSSIVSNSDIPSPKTEPSEVANNVSPEPKNVQGKTSASQLSLPPLLRIEQPEQIVQQIKNGKESAIWQVKRPESVTLINFPYPEPIFTMCIIFSTFFSLAALFLYLSILGGDATTAFIAFWSSSCFGFFMLVTMAANCWLRDLQLSSFLRNESISNLLLIILPEGFIDYADLSGEPMQLFSFADLQDIFILHDPILNIAWLELTYLSGKKEIWKPRAFFGLPLDTCSQIATTFTNYIRIHESHPHFKADIVSQIIQMQSLSQISLSNMINTARKGLIRLLFILFTSEIG